MDRDELKALVEGAREDADFPGYFLYCQVGISGVRSSFGWVDSDGSCARAMTWRMSMRLSWITWARRRVPVAYSGLPRPCLTRLGSMRVWIRTLRASKRRAC